MKKTLLGISLSLFMPALAVAHGDAVVKDGYETTAVTYACANNATLNVRYLNMKNGPSFVVLSIKSEIILLETAVSASGARYVSADPATPYQWWTKGDAATLDLLGPDGNIQANILSGCKDGH